MLRRKPFFRGDTPQHQLETIVSVLGKPSDSALAKIKHEAARKAIFAGAECEPGQRKGAKIPTSKAHISVVFHSFWLIFGRVIISRNGLEA